VIERLRDVARYRIFRCYVSSAQTCRRNHYTAR
jgi:hypothetical protein